MLAALSATWTGGSANLVAVKQIDRAARQPLPSVLLADALCYSVWVVVLFSISRFAPAFNRWTARRRARAAAAGASRAAIGHAGPGSVLLWLGIGVAGGQSRRRAVAALLPVGGFLTHDRVDGADRDDRRPGASRARRSAAFPVPAPLASAHAGAAWSRCWRRRATSQGLGDRAAVRRRAASRCCCVHVALLAAGGAPVPFRPAPVRHLLAGADRRRGDRAGAGRDVFAARWCRWRCCWRCSA